jgi:hypothetical protein
MKKILIGCGGISVVLVVILACLIGSFAYRASRLDKEVVIYLERELPAIISTWDSQALLDRSSPELLATLKSSEDTERLFVVFRRLGPLKKLATPTGAVSSGAFSGTGSFTLGRYTADATFEHGSAQLRIQVRRSESGWKIDGFHVNSDLFLPPKP